MERPQYEPSIARQNSVYAMDVIERYYDKSKTAEALLAAVTDAFILGAGGYEGSFDAAYVLEHGGMAVLLESLGLEWIDKDMGAVVDTETFESAVRASVDYGAAWDDVEDEITDGSTADTSITGDAPFLGPITGRWVWYGDE